MSRAYLQDKQRVVIKIGTSTITHTDTGHLNLVKLEKFVRILTDIHNQNKELIIVSSGAIGAGRKALGIQGKPSTLPMKQACAAVGQARLMMIYQKLFAEYNHVAAQVLMTKNTIAEPLNRFNAKNTFSELLKLGAIPIVNENDTVSTFEIEFGDNDTLSAIVAALIDADLLILLSDIDGLYTDDPNKNPDAEFISVVDHLDDSIMGMGKGTSSSVGTGGMGTKLSAARIATSSGADMIIANAADVRIIHRIMDGREYGTLFKAHKSEEFDLVTFIENM